MTLSLEVLSVLAVALSVLVVLLAVALGLVAARLRRLNRAYASVLDPDRREDLFQAIERYVGEVDQLRDDVGVVHRNTEHLRELQRDAVSRLGVVRYDAFEDMGGALSFSAALLDERGDGVVVTAINGRTEARTYAKPVSKGTSQHNLSPEEEAAIEAATSGDKGTAAAAPRRRRGRAAS